MKTSAAEKAAFSPLLDLPLYPPNFLHPVFHTKVQVACSMLAGILLLYHSLKSICFFVEFDPKTPMEVSPLAAHVDFLHVFFIFFYCV